MYGEGMTRLARGRDTHLTPEEIAAEALRQFDEGREPSIRGLASALGVAPSAIYHHYDSRAAIVDAVLATVWEEAGEEGLRLVAGEAAPGPVEILVAAALATRRAFGRHHQLAPYLAATQEANERLAANLGLLASAFEGLGLHGGEAGEAFHAYGSYAIGSTLVRAARLNFGKPQSGRNGSSRASAEEGGEGVDGTRAELEAMMNVSYSDPERDEELFVDGLRRLIVSFTQS
jgi:AcrR family transcriptional regulator